MIVDIVSGHEIPRISQLFRNSHHQKLPTKLARLENKASSNRARPRSELSPHGTTQPLSLSNRVSFSAGSRPPVIESAVFGNWHGRLVPNWRAPTGLGISGMRARSESINRFRGEKRRAGKLGASLGCYKSVGGRIFLPEVTPASHWIPPCDRHGWMSEAEAPLLADGSIFCCPDWTVFFPVHASINALPRQLLRAFFALIDSRLKTPTADDIFILLQSRFWVM